jgi:hypothetical protein
MAKKTKRKRRRDKEDEELAAQIAEIAGVVNYMQKITAEEIQKKGELYLKQGRTIAEMSMLAASEDIKHEEEISTDFSSAEDVMSDEGLSTDVVLNMEEKTSTGLVLNPEDEKLSTDVVLNNDPGISTDMVLNKISTARVLNNDSELSTDVVLNNETSTAGVLNVDDGLSTIAIPNLYHVKVSFEQEHLLRFISGAYSILFCPEAEHRIKLILLAALLKATCEKSCSTKVKTNDLLRDLRMSKSLQKKIPEEAEKAGLAEINVKKKGGTEVTFNEEIFNPNCKNSSIEIDRLINIYNLSIRQRNDEEKIEERKSIPLLETGKYVMIVSLYLAGFPLNAITGSLMETIKGKDPELVAAFWIYAMASTGRIKSPGAYLIKVLENNDTGSLSGEIMEKAKTCVRSAQTIVRETYDEPELAFLKNLAQKLSLTDAYYKDRASLTAELKKAGRKLIDECEETLKKLPNIDNQK